MKIQEFMGADFDPLARLLGTTWHAQHADHSFWQGADELCDYLSLTDKGFVVKGESGELLGAMLLRSPREEDHNGTMRMHWLQQRTRIAAMATALGIDARADVKFLNEENEFMREADEQRGSDGVGIVKLLIVAPEARGAGVGRTLFEQGCVWLKEHGATTVRLVTDDECDWQFYEHDGMDRVMERPYQFIYEKALT